MSTREAFHNWNDQQPESFYADKNKYDLMLEAWQNGLTLNWICHDIQG